MVILWYLWYCDSGDIVIVVYWDSGDSGDIVIVVMLW